MHQVNKVTGHIYGLSFVPTLEPDFRDDQIDFPNHLRFRDGQDDNSPEVLDIVSRIVEQESPASVMEIGVSLYEKNKTMTDRIFRAKSSECIYLGVDICDRSYLNDTEKNIHTVRCDASDQAHVRATLKSLGMNSLDLIIIDSLHSVNGAVNDWKYVDMLSENGIVLIHDTNSHPGPYCLAQAIDRDIFDVDEPLKGKKDFGILIARKRCQS